MRHPLKANALFFTIVISLVIALLCSSLIFIAYYQRLQVQNNQLKVRLIRNANSAIQLMLASTTSSDSASTIDLFGKGQDSVLIRQTSWGLYEIGHVTAYSHGDTVKRTFMLGSVPDSIWKGALYLLDQGRPVTLAGNTLIKGTAYLPEAGPKRGWVDGKNYEREKLVYGDIKKSNSQLPKLSELFLKSLIKQVDYHYKGVALSEKALQADSLVAPFSQPTVHIHSKRRPLELSRVCLKGNIIVSSDTMIIVSSSAKLDNIILTAPKIQFKDDFDGKVQAFVTDTLLTGEGSHFRYPSSFSLLEIDSIDNRPKIVVSKNCTFEGVILQYVSFIDRSLATIQVHSESQIKGQIYADGLISMEGKLLGSLVCNKFLLSRPSGVYENHLLDCTLDRTALSSHFLGSPLFTNRKKGIMQWIE